MTDANKTLLVHAACVLVIVGCVVLDVTVLQPYPAAGKLAIGAATWLWGKLGFVPTDPVVTQLLADVDPSKLADALAKK